MLDCQNAEGCGKCSRLTECSFEIKNAFSTRKIEELGQFIPLVSVQRMDIADELIEMVQNRAEQNPLLAEEVAIFVLALNKATKKVQRLMRAKTRLEQIIKNGATEGDAFNFIRQGPDEASMLLVVLRDMCTKEFYKRAIALCRELAKKDDEYSSMLNVLDRFDNRRVMENVSVILKQTRDQQPQNPSLN